jgi:CHAT domain-containing protein
VPFAALPVRPVRRSARLEPLVLSNEVVSLPSLSMLPLLRAAQHSGSFKGNRMAVFADPVYEPGDPRLAQGKPTNSAKVTVRSDATAPALPSDLAVAVERVRGRQHMFVRLVGTARESAAIARLAEGMTVSRFEGTAASRRTALSGELARYDIIHFATHGLANNQRPELSGLVLSLYDERSHATDGFLRLVDIYGLTLTADLVVLSACDSARGKQVSGEGVIGLTRGFVLAGAARVVSSLWQVDDLATTDLMSAFYDGLLRQGLPPSSALRQAQVRLWKGKRWRSPYYWAAFTLYGE